MNKKMIVYTLGRMLMLEGIMLGLPFMVGLIYQEKEVALIFGEVALVLLGIGYLLSYKRPLKTKIHAREGFLIVALAWTVLSLFGALPFYLSREIPSYIDAFFETVSGFTTTGSSILTNIEGMSHAGLFWRSFSHWVGGMGILVFVVAILPDSYGSSLHILRAEIPGPIVGKLVSKIKVTAQILYKIYLGLTLMEVVLLMFGGMPLFDSLVNSFGTAGTGGFAIKNASIAAYDSAYIDAVITIFMLLFGINFNLFYFMLLKHFRDVYKNHELRWYITIIVGATLFITLNILHLYPNMLQALRYASFQVVSVITITGYITADYGQWPMFSQAILFCLMFVGACAGSTGGGMKISRIMIVCKNAKKELKQLIHPHSVSTVKLEGEPLSASVLNSIHAYFIFYFLILFISFLIVSLDNLDFASSFSSVVTCLNNVGPGFNVVGPVGNFSSLSGLAKLVLSFDMLVGRLELFPFLVLFMKDMHR